MVDVDRRMNTHAHVAGLKRLSARASKGPAATTTPREVCFSFAPFARNVIDGLTKHQVQIDKGLSGQEFAKIEATLGFSFPPDLKAILQEGLPVGVGFPDWRSGSLQQLRMRLNLPIAGLSYEVSRGRFWTKQWGPKPPETEQAVRIARAALKKVPILIPLFNHCYIPSSPNLAGNPVFFVHQNDVFVCTYDLADFFQRQDFTPSGQQALTKFANIELIRGRTASLGSGADWASGNGRSFRREKPANSATARRDYSIDLGSSRDVGSGTDSISEEEEVPVWKCEEPWRDPEAWGRNLDSLARRYDHCVTVGERPRRSVDGLDSQRVFRFSDFYLSSADSSPRLVEDAISSNNTVQERSTSEVSFAHFSTKAASGAAKVTRRIEFWSDLGDKGQSICSVYGTSDERLYSLSKVDVDVSKPSLKEDVCNGRTLTNLLDSCVPQWLANFLEEMATILRGGGWKEEDITEAFSVAPSPQEHDIFLDRQSMLEELVLHANLLSDGLRRAGWSTQEVSEALDVGLSFQEERRRPYKIPAHLSARIAKLAEYVVRP